MELRSGDFEPGGRIPRKHTREGEDTSPPLAWSGLPIETKSLALIVEDPDAPRGTFTHWLMWDIPIERAGLPEGVEHAGDFNDGRRQGDNDFDERGYSGPMPPKGECHRYVFRLFALDDRLLLEEGATKEQLLQAMQGHVIQEAKLIGRYEREG
jgi:Raf kinase inhibitor-like YbhB/YbcL family protein